jgi:hypothetical protein
VVAGCARWETKRTSPHQRLLETNSPRDHVAAKLATLTARADVDGIAAMLEGDVGYGGLWFSDSECSRILPRPGTIHASGTRAFAECLATLKLSAGSRKSPMLDVAVMTYEPGIEIEIVLGGTRSKPTIRWIGFLAPHDGEPQPTIAPEVLERNRVEGTLDIAIEGVVWVKVCTDVEGGVTSHRPLVAHSVSAQLAVLREVTRWRFRPFMLADASTPICSVVRIGKPSAASALLPYPPPPDYDDGTIIVSPTTLVRRTGERLIVPDNLSAVRDAGLSRIEATLQYCVTSAGRVDRVWILQPSPFAAWNRKLAVEVAKWTFDPIVVDGKPMRGCTYVTFGVNLR